MLGFCPQGTCPDGLCPRPTPLPGNTLSGCTPGPQALPATPGDVCPPSRSRSCSQALHRVTYHSQIFPPRALFLSFRGPHLSPALMLPYPSVFLSPGNTPPTLSSPSEAYTQSKYLPIPSNTLIRLIYAPQVICPSGPWRLLTKLILAHQEAPSGCDRAPTPLPGIPVPRTTVQSGTAMQTPSDLPRQP